MTDETVRPVELFSDPAKGIDWAAFPAKCSSCDKLIGLVEIVVPPGSFDDGFRLAIYCLDCQAVFESEVGHYDDDGVFHPAGEGEE